MSTVLPMASVPTFRYWSGYRTHLDQTGDTCVANAWTHMITDSPRSHRLADIDADLPAWPGGWSAAYRSAQSGEQGFRGWLYDQAQQRDEFDDTPPSGGTSVRAGAKVLQAMGVIASYHWASTITDVANAILTTGPVIVGTEWTEDMFTPTGANCIIHPTGPVVGGHAYKIDGYNQNTRLFRMKNSWSTSWGDNGYAHISRDDLSRLLFESDGEAAIATEA